MTGATSPVTADETLADAVARLLSETGCSKRTAVRLALLKAIQDGRFNPGDMLPPERRLADELGISLGTVQAALNELRESGRITRRRGDGTRVAVGADKFRTTWHFRLLDQETGKPLFWDSAKVDVNKVGGDGPYTGFLPEAHEYVRIRRRILMGGRHRVGADLWMPAETGRPLLKMNVTDLSLINLRTVFAEKLGLKPVRVETEITTVMPEDTLAAALELRRHQPHYQIEARIFAGDDSPLYFQRVLACVDEVRLSF